MQSVYQALVIVLDFVITAFQFSPQTSEFGHLPATQDEMREPEAVTGLIKGQRGRGPWSVIIWGDDRHTINEVTRQIRDSCGVTWEIAERWAREVEEVVSLRLVQSDTRVAKYWSPHMTLGSPFTSPPCSNR
jgi:E3 ubiquitin-protein ligase UBR1